MIKAFILPVALIVAGSAQAQVYKCVDANGKTVYSQAPCPRSSKSTTLPNVAASPPNEDKKAAAAKGAGPRSSAELEQEFKKRRLEQEEARKKQDESAAQAKAKEENCQNAKQQLATLELGGRQQRVNQKGERYFLDDAQIASEKERARRTVESSCK